MSFYIIEDDEGLVLGDCMEFETNMDNAILYDEPSEPEGDVKEYGGHVVELVEAPAKVVVSEDMASWLSDAKEMRMPIEFLARCKVPDGDQEDMLRAYVNGWEVEKHKRYVLPMPSGNPDEKSMRFAKRLGPQNWQPSKHRHTVGEVSGLVSFLVTQADIDAAPNWVKAITPVEVTEDDY